MKCSSCGRALGDADKYCGYCGLKVGTVATTGRSFGPKLLPVAIVVVVVVIAAIGVAVQLSSTRDKRTVVAATPLAKESPLDTVAASPVADETLAADSKQLRELTAAIRSYIEDDAFTFVVKRAVVLGGEALVEAVPTWSGAPDEVTWYVLRTDDQGWYVDTSEPASTNVTRVGLAWMHVPARLSDAFMAGSGAVADTAEPDAPPLLAQMAKADLKVGLYFRYNLDTSATRVARVGGPNGQVIHSGWGDQLTDGTRVSFKSQELPEGTVSEGDQVLLRVENLEDMGDGSYRFEVAFVELVQ